MYDTIGSFEDYLKRREEAGSNFARTSVTRVYIGQVGENTFVREADAYIRALLPSANQPEKEQSLWRAVMGMRESLESIENPKLRNKGVDVILEAIAPLVELEATQKSPKNTGWDSVHIIETRFRNAEETLFSIAVMQAPYALDAGHKKKVIDLWERIMVAHYDTANTAARMVLVWRSVTDRQLNINPVPPFVKSMQARFEALDRRYAKRAGWEDDDLDALVEPDHEPKEEPDGEAARAGAIKRRRMPHRRPKK